MKETNEIINIFCEKYNTNKSNIYENNHTYFRYLCFKFNYFMKHIHLPKIKKHSTYEAVLIEFRIMPHLEFLIRNTIHKLGNKWAHTVVCGNLNYDYMVNMCEKISPHIQVIKIYKDNITPSEYSEILTNTFFWDLLKGEKILIYQEDSCIFKHNIQSFIQFDYVGAPFPKRVNDTPNLVGNGGFSLRSKSKMVDVINRISVSETDFNSSTQKYIINSNSTFPPEDVYFSKNMQELNIGLVADWDTASLFSMESVYNENSLGGHKFWISNKMNWKSFFKNTFNYNKYIFHSNIIEYLKFNNIPVNFNKTNTIKNAFDIDLYFFCKANHFPYTTNTEILQNIKQIGLNGFIYHPKQLLNIYPNIILYHFLENIYVFYELASYPIQEFVSKFVYGLSYIEMSEVLIRKKHSQFNKDIDLLLVVFIGNEERGVDLINKIIEYGKIQCFNVSFCFNDSTILHSEKIKHKIKQHFQYYGIYLSKNLGTDITSTILMTDHIYREYNFKHIIKLHTKSILKEYNELTNYLLSLPLCKLVLDKNNHCNCIGNRNNYKDLYEDVFNNELKIKHSAELDYEKLFVAGTIFYCPSIVFKKVSQFIQKNNYRCYLLNNLYENNCINKDFSPIHFLERLFGVILL